MAGMTNYSIDSDARKKAVLCCAGVSIAASLWVNYFVFPAFKAWGIANGYEWAFTWLEQNGILGQLAPFALFGLLWLFFDNLAWKWKLIAKIHGIPDLNGQWRGTAVSNFKDENGDFYRYGMSLKITQSFTKMSCVSKFKHSESEGGIIGLVGCKDGDGRYKLGFSYGNTADESFVKVDGWQEKHEGFNIIVCEGDHMDGHYFTNRNSATIGTFSLDRQI